MGEFFLVHMVWPVDYTPALCYVTGAIFSELNFKNRVIGG